MFHKSIYLFILLITLLTADHLKESIQYPSADAIEIKFSKDTFIGKNNGIIVVGTDGEVFHFYGKQAQNQKILVFGNFVNINFEKETNHYHLELEYSKPILFSDLVSTSAIVYSRGASDEELKDELYNNVKDHVSLGYGPGRELMFSDFDNQNGYVECVYTGAMVKTNSIPDATVMNTEHTWPKSKGAKNDPAKSDLHHLFPTDSETNSRRSSYSFGDVVRVDWSNGGSVLGADKNGYTVFSPRPRHRGDVARALFYFSVRYRLKIPSYEESVIKRWHTEDPVDQKEIERNDNISKYQKNRNPFIDDPSLVDRISDF